jgi:hypothetical protein
MKWSNISQLAFCTLIGVVALQPIERIAQAIVINDTAGTETARMLGAPFTPVTEIFIGGGFCSGALMAQFYVITAQHCIFGEEAGDVAVRFRNSNPLNTLIEEISVTNIFEIDATNDLLDGTDVAILELSSPSPEFITPLRFLDDVGDLVGSTATTVGFGYNGVGSVGHQFTGDGLRWGAENVIDLFNGAAFNGTADEVGFSSIYARDDTAASQYGITIPNTSNIFSTDFDNGTAENNTMVAFGSSALPLTNEGTTAPGDSGSPLLVNFNDEWLIAGVLSGGTTFTSEYGDISWWTGTQEHRSFIEQLGGEFASVPEPSSALALITVGALGASIGWTRKRQHNS